MSVLPEKCQNFRNLGGGVRLSPLAPRPVRLCYLVKLAAGLLFEKKKIQHLCFALHFFILYYAHLGLD